MHKYVRQVKDLYESHRNPENAIPMKKYLKNKFKHLGIKRPERNMLNKELLLRNNRPHKEELMDIVYEFWDLPEREFQYFALDLLGYYKNDPEKIKWVSF